ncbi:MAG: uroporphyrinogen-III C-methyltransferase [Methylobacteriaceae bacterium]|nr:uroporphyrinogen-III C-methyltransferase [Methylobacteriaceae bacterium]
MRRPGGLGASRIGELATLPVFFVLGDRRVILAGSSAGALWKAELLQAAGARVDLFGEFGSEDLAQFTLGEHVRHQHRHWIDADFKGAALAIGEFESDADAASFRAAAHRAGVPVNIVDRPALCDFQFGSIVNRSPLVIGISTAGAAPVFGQALRAQIETLLPAGFTRWAEAARAWRPSVQALDLDFRARRDFWEAFTREALSRPNETPSEAIRGALLDHIREPDAGKQIGTVLLVGAGPGDPELLTLKAVRVLQSADVVLFDDLVSPAIVDMARREAARITVGKRGHKPSCGQDEISALLVKLAREGKKVVRLKGGDPTIFGRMNEELEALRAAGIPFEIVPGVTAASGAAAAAGVSLTERDLARRVQFITAHTKEGQLPDDLDWQALADPGATTAVYMGVKTLPRLIERLLASGIAPEMPALFVESASRPEERIIAAPLADLPAKVAAAGAAGPGLVLIGAVVEHAEAYAKQVYSQALPAESWQKKDKFVTT